MTPLSSPLHTLRHGQRLYISHPLRGSCNGEALHVETPANLPAFDGAPEIELVRSILAERNVQQLALIAFDDGEPRQCFIAFGDGHGRWWDLQQQELTIREEQQP